MRTMITPAADGSGSSLWREIYLGIERYWALVVYKTYADLRAEAARTYIGVMWWVLDPIATMFVYYIVFGFLFDRGGLEYVQFLFVGIVSWRWFNTSLMKGSNCLINTRSLMRQVYIPKTVFPIVSLLVDTFKFAIVLVILVIFLALTGAPITAAYFALPLVIFLQGLFIAGVTLPVSAITPFFPDIRMVIDNMVRLMFFLSGIFYDVGEFSESTQRLFRLNPMVVIIDWYRGIMLRGTLPDLGSLATVLVISAVLVSFGWWLIRRFDFDYPKIAF